MKMKGQVLATLLLMSSFAAAEPTSHPCEGVAVVNTSELLGKSTRIKSDRVAESKAADAERQTMHTKNEQEQNRDFKRVVDDIAKKRHLCVVLVGTQFVYADLSVDITSDVITAYDTEWRKQSMNKPSTQRKK